MSPASIRSLSARSAAAIAVAALSISPAAAQNFGVAFSIDSNSTNVGVFDSGQGLFISASDVLFAPAPSRIPALGPLLPPSINIKGGLPSGAAPHLAIGTHGACYGVPGGGGCPDEVDALDLGTAIMLLPGQPFLGVYFSTDNYATGLGFGSPPSIATEGPVGDLQCDVLVDMGLGAAMPLAPLAAANLGSIAVLDGNGMVSGSGFVNPGLGLREPWIPGLPSDNVDALAFTSVPNSSTPFIYPAGGVRFSMDSGFVDPLTGVANTGSAAVNGFVGGDVLWQAAANTPALVWAPAVMLGLDLAGPDTDDVDAIVVWSNSTPGFQPSQQPFDWAGGPSDMLLFSVRRGSAVIGMPDSIFGLPINPGDILTTPLAPANGGVSPFPGIFVAAENLGLGAVGAGRITASPLAIGDELDALDLSRGLFDCDNNGVDDSVDLANGTHTDFNGNGIPDICEPPFFTSFCHCQSPLGPCGNNDPTAGCQNSTGQGALMTPSGSNSVVADNLVLTTTQMPTNVACLMFTSSNLGAPIPFFDGRRCLYGPLARFNIANTGAGGQVVYGPGLVNFSVTNFPVFNWFTSGSTFGFQTWYRDPTGPCAQFSNLSNAVSVLFIP